jgi:hypothetical protein
VDEEEQLEGQKFLLPEIFDEPREEDVEQEHVDWISFFVLSKCICVSTCSDSLVTLYCCSVRQLHHFTCIGKIKEAKLDTYIFI